MTIQHRSSDEIPVPQLPAVYMTRDSSRGRASLVAGRDAKGAASLDALLRDLDQSPPPARSAAPSAAPESKLRELEQRLERLEGSAAKYRDIWKSGRTYQANDMVTWAGSMWVCRVGPTQDKPGISGSWRLATKSKDR